MPMKVEIKKIERGQIELTIEIDVEQYQLFLQKAAEAISQVIKIPGFRPGKASFDIVKKQVGEGKIWEEAIEPAVQKTFVQALDQEKLIKNLQELETVLSQARRKQQSRVPIETTPAVS